MNHTLFGIAYCSKYSGNTVLAVLQNSRIYFLDVEKDVDADNYILSAADHFKPDAIFLNAPLSLPGVYSQKEGFADFHFRKADEELCAVSPLINGGITARAMELKSSLEKAGNTKVYETCNKAQAKNYELDKLGYKNGKLSLITCRNQMSAKLNQNLLLNCQNIQTWQHMDAFLSLISAMRFVSGLAMPFGDEKEGMIYV